MTYFTPRNSKRTIHDFLRSFALNVYTIGGNDFEISRNFIEAFLFTRSAKSAVRDTWTISPAVKLSFCRSTDGKYRKSREKTELAKEEGTVKFHRRNREAEKLPANGELFLEQFLKRLVKTVILIS